MSLFKVSGEAASADILLQTEFKKMVEEEGYSPKQMFDVDNKIYYTKC
jgi:hypothetical protein